MWRHLKASAKRLIAANGSNFIDGQALTRLIEDYLHFTQAKAAARALVEQLRTRNFILCYLGADSYAFVHRTFLEYFCAADIVHQFNVAKTLSEQDLIALFDTHCRDDDWREVLRLICGQIDEQFVGHIVEHLATRTDLEKWDGDTPLPELPLAIWCLSEARTTANLGSVATHVFEQVCSYLRGAVRNLFNAPQITQTLDDVINGIRESTIRWPDKPEVLEWSFVGDRQHEIYAIGARYWGCLVIYVSNDRAEAERYVRKGTVAASRVGSLQALAEKWPDENTRELLAQRAVQDANEYPRRAALPALAEKWPDENTRELLAQRAVQDDNYAPRSAALQALVEKWPGENTRKLLAERAVDSTINETRRGEHLCTFGKMHSEFGRVVFTEDLSGWGSYLDPRQPISREHIERAAKRTDIPADKIDETVRSLSEHLGWDITKGLR